MFWLRKIDQLKTIGVFNNVVGQVGRCPALLPRSLNLWSGMIKLKLDAQVIVLLNKMRSGTMSKYDVLEAQSRHLRVYLVTFIPKMGKIL